MCNASLADFLPLSIPVTDGKLPTVAAIRSELALTVPATGGISEMDWGRVASAIGGLTSLPELLAPGCIVTVQHDQRRRGGEMPRAQWPLEARLVQPKPS